LVQRFVFAAYGVGCHLLFLLTYAYMAGFVGNLLVPISIDSTPSDALSGVVVDIALMGLFALQHSIMARPWFKRRWTQFVPQPIERSTYVLLSCVALFLLMWQWRSINAVLWDVQQPLGRALLWGLFAAGWVLVPAVSLMINHFDLFGTRQVWLFWKRRPYAELPFKTPMLYSRIRHPLYIGWTMAFWATPTMTAGHALLAVVLTLYMAIAVVFEERDLVAHFGDEYRDYQRRVPKYIPRLGAATPADSEAPSTVGAAAS
jgi:protein-S-isoprenylcysteine O-methyltransferase Ste14